MHYVLSNDLSHTYLLQYGVPQGSVLGPLLYVLYTAEVCHVVERHSMHLHLYADDSQIYTSVAVCDTTSAVHRLAVCIADVNNWMSASRLRFNPTKTEIMWLGAGHLLQQVDNQWHPCAVFHRQSRAVGAWPWRHTRQPAVTLCSHCCALSVWLLSVATDSTSYPGTHTWRCQEHCSGVYRLSFGLV